MLCRREVKSITSRQVFKERSSLIHQKTSRFEFFSSIFVGLVMSASLFTQLMPNMQHIEAFFDLGIIWLLVTYLYISNQFKKLYELSQQLCD